MSRARRVLTAIVLTASSLATGRPPLDAQAPPVPGERLQFVAVLSRHGVRSPTNTAEDLQDYAPQPWATWDAPAAYMTPRGNRLVHLLGVYEREYLTQAGLLAASGCADVNRFYFWADAMGRDIESAWILGRAMMPDCNITIHRVPEGSPDPLFQPRAVRLGPYDAAKARAAFLAVVGGSAEAVLDKYRADLEMVEAFLFGCRPIPDCSPGAKEVKKRILTQPALLLPENGGASSPAIAAAHAVAEAIVLQYMNGVDEKAIAWGRFDASRLRELQRFEGRYWETLTTPYAASAGESNLLSHLLRSLEQAASGSAVPGSLGRPGDKALFVLGHDTNIKRMARLLGLSWALEQGGPLNETPPGASLRFELWGGTAGGKQTVRVYLQSQTLEQIRRMTPLSLKTPPLRVALALPECGAGAEGLSCEWQRFRAIVESKIDPAFVAPVAAGGR